MGAEGRDAAGDVQQAERTDQQRGPADLGWRQGRVPVRVAHEPPARQPEQDRDGECPLARGRARQHVDVGEGGVVEADPDGGREHDREPEEGQPDAVPLMIGVQVPRVAAEAPDDGAHQPREQHPGHRDGPQQPPGQRDQQVAGRRRRALPAAAGGGRVLAAPGRRLAASGAAAGVP
jgi:hypothetical protein